MDNGQVERGSQEVGITRGSGRERRQRLRGWRGMGRVGEGRRGMKGVGRGSQSLAWSPQD